MRVVDPSSDEYEAHGAHIALRREEAFKSICNDIADYVSARIVSTNEITNPRKMVLVAEVIGRFDGRGLSAEQLRALVDAAIRQEMSRRQEITAWRLQQRREKVARDAKRAQMLSSRLPSPAASAQGGP